MDFLIFGMEMVVVVLVARNVVLIVSPNLFLTAASIMVNISNIPI